ncbi:MAG TPA: glycosyltransferase family 39 protein [Candidatus Binatia bacterium]
MATQARSATQANGAELTWSGVADAGASWLDRHALVVSVRLFAVNLALKLPLVAAQSIWFDEAVTLRNAHAPFDLASSLAGDATPPIYALLVQAWLSVFGVTIEAARTLSVLLSAATAVLLFQLGRRFIDAPTGLWAALLLTTSRYQLYYGHEARLYALVGLLCVASFHALLLLLERRSTRRIVALAVLDTALLYTHYVAGLMFPVQFVVAALRGEDRVRNVATVVACQAVALIAFVPCLLYVLSAWPPPMTEWIRAPGAREAIDVLTGFAGSSTLLAIDALLLAGGAAAIAASTSRAGGGAAVRGTAIRDVAGGGVADEPGWTTAAMLGAWAFLPLVLAFVASQIVAVFLDRYLLYTTLGLYLLLAWVLMRLPVRPLLRHGAALALCALSLLTAWRDPITRTDWRAAAERVRAASGAGEIVVVVPPYQLLPLAYHVSPEAFADRERLPERLRAERVLALASPREIATLASHAQPPAVLVVMTDTSAALHPELASVLSQSGLERTSSETLRGLVLERFAPRR